MFQKWKEAGKPLERTDTSRIAYLTARGDFQYVRRYEENLKSTCWNNDLMVAGRSDKDRIYSMMKTIRKQTSTPQPLRLETPVGTYFGDDILEGFAADAEHLGRHRGESSSFDNNFYRLCKLDNYFIFDFKGTEQVKIPAMTMSNFEDIIHKKMKPGKACDLYHLTVEHIREAGQLAKQCILKLLNNIISDIYLLTCPQVKIGLASSLHKGKLKPADKSSSYRRITVTPVFGNILDRFLDPQTESIFRPKQSPDQLGFTKGISYLMAAIQRGECQQWALDHKLTCFGVSLDGESAFPSVDRDIQVRELYSVGEQGDILKYSRNTYKNTECKLKQDGKLSRTIMEFTGNRQGHVKAAGHFKVYINPCLEAVNRADLGFRIGPITVNVVCCADDTYIMSGSPSALQSAINIVNHYAKRYRVIFNANKTKIIVCGSKVDMDYYQAVSPWSLGKEKICVATDNEHLGLIVSGWNEEQKNADNNINQCRRSIFGLLGPAFSFKCKLSPSVQLHLWRLYSLPVLRSGLAALPIRPSVLKSLQTFHHKILRGFLKLSRTSPIPSLYFLSGELPIEASLHLDLLSLFFNILFNPQTKVFEIVKYILMMSDSKSTTWSAHLRLICIKYNLPDPLMLMQNPAPSKSYWKMLTTTKITIHHEVELRQKAENNSKMKYLNVRLLGLSGKPHPIISNITDSRDVPKLRTHLKFLTEDILTYERLSKDQGTDPHCRLCLAPVESTEHLLTICRGTADVRERLHADLVNLVADIDPTCAILEHSVPKDILTQFIIDPTSMNLPNGYRISIVHPRLQELYKMSRDWCFGVNSKRISLLRKEKENILNI